MSWRPVGGNNGLGMFAKRDSVVYRVLSFVGAVKCRCRLGLSMVAPFKTTIINYYSRSLCGCGCVCVVVVRIHTNTITYLGL